MRLVQMRNRLSFLFVIAAAIAVAGCAHVNRDELVTELDQLRGEMRTEMEAGDDALAGDIDRLDSSLAELEREVAANRERLEALDGELEAFRVEFGATVERMEGMIAFNVPVHFDFDSAVIRDSDKPVLERFAEVVGAYYAGSVITVEGFADPAGDSDYNLRLGKRRAEGVKSYLTEVAQLDGTIRTITYGEAEDRQIEPGAWGKDGESNRRVTLVIDYRGVDSEF